MHNTFNGWKQQGRVVISGERGRYRNEYGDYMFHISQTKERFPRIRIDSLGRAYIKQYI